MRKNAKRFTGAILSIFMLTGMCGGHLSAAGAALEGVQTENQEEAIQPAYFEEDVINCGDNYEWEGVLWDDDEIIIVGSNTLDWASDGVLEIPAQVDGRTVIGVGGVGYSGFRIFSPELITTIKFPDTVTTIEDQAFSKFGNLTTIYCPDNTEYDGPNSYTDPFEGCTKIETIYANSYDYGVPVYDSVKTVTYYDGVTEVRDYGGTNLTTINLPDSIEKFGWSDAPELSALNCSKPIEQIIVTSTRNCPKLCIPVNAGTVSGIQDDYSNSGITAITLRLTGSSWNDKDAFLNCPNLTAINVTDPNGEFHSEDGVLWWNNDLYTYPAGKSWAGNYDVPANTQCIYLYAFDSCKFTSLTFPENMNPNYYWDGYDTTDNPKDSVFENTSITKIRIVPRSAAMDYYSTREELAERFKVSADQIEFYLGNTYQITYQLDGGTNAPGKPASYRAGEDPVTLAAPSKEGYVFLGWKRSDVSGGYESTTERAYDGYFENYVFTACWCKELPYADTSVDGWYYAYVSGVYERGIMTGLNETTFGPADPLARAQFATILYRMNDKPPVEYKAVFPDVPKGEWFTNAILWAAETQVVKGYDSTGLFGPADYINREQMAVMMYRYVNYKGYASEQPADISGYQDADKVNTFAQEAMKWAVGNGIISGKENEDGTVRLDPQGSANRAECATIIMRFLEKFEE